MNNDPLQFQYSKGKHGGCLIKLPMSKGNDGRVTPNIKILYRKINARNIYIMRFRQLISSRRPASQQRFLEGSFKHPYLTPSQKPPPMRSSRRTTPHFAENSFVEDATDACSLRCIFATFLAYSSASLGRPYLYLIQSNGWKSLSLLTGLSV